MAGTGKDEQESQHGFAARSKCSKVVNQRSNDYQRARCAGIEQSRLASLLEWPLLEWPLQTGAERGEDRTFHVKSNTSPLSTSKIRIMCTPTVALAVWLRGDNSLLWLYF